MQGLITSFEGTRLFQDKVQDTLLNEFDLTPNGPQSDNTQNRAVDPSPHGINYLITPLEKSHISWKDEKNKSRSQNFNGFIKLQIDVWHIFQKYQITFQMLDR